MRKILNFVLSVMCCGGISGCVGLEQPQNYAHSGVSKDNLQTRIVRYCTENFLRPHGQKAYQECLARWKNLNQSPRHNTQTYFHHPHRAHHCHGLTGQDARQMHCRQWPHAHGVIPQGESAKSDNEN